MEWLILAAGVVAVIFVVLWALTIGTLVRQNARLQASNMELAGTLGELARVEHGVPPANAPVVDWAAVEKEHRDIFGSKPHIAFPRAETLDDPRLEADPNQLGEWDVPPGLLDAAGDEDMT